MGGNLNFMWILLIVGVVIAGFYFWKKKKNGSSGGTEIKKRHEGDEVWKAIKDFLKMNDEKGKEIVETYVAKRPNPDVINRTLSKEEQKKQKEEIKLRKQEEKKQEKEDRANGKKPKKNPPKELYVILFVTRSTKTKQDDPPRAIECEVKNIPKGRKETERKIIINGEKDYKVESEWILPIKKAEEDKIRKEYESQQKWKKMNPFKKHGKSNEAIDPDKLEKLKEKELKKEEKRQEKIKKEKEKWEKKETVVKTKK